MHPKPIAQNGSHKDKDTNNKQDRARHAPVKARARHNVKRKGRADCKGQWGIVGDLWGLDSEIADSL